MKKWKIFEGLKSWIVTINNTCTGVPCHIRVTRLKSETNRNRYCVFGIAASLEKSVYLTVNKAKCHGHWYLKT